MRVVRPAFWRMRLRTKRQVSHSSPFRPRQGRSAGQILPLLRVALVQFLHSRLDTLLLLGRQPQPLLDLLVSEGLYALLLRRDLQAVRVSLSSLASETGARGRLLRSLETLAPRGL